ncbi:hypothetical protein FQA39_LY07607 [Lamprigera yunnana]|nr:hypothetical protein FQA39_LY07607 [Lamprigera yunnana]
MVRTQRQFTPTCTSLQDVSRKHINVLKLVDSVMNKLALMLHLINLDDDSTFDPEILEDLETNILNNENDDIELEIFERSKDDNEEKEEN